VGKWSPRPWTERERKEFGALIHGEEARKGFVHDTAKNFVIAEIRVAPVRIEPEFYCSISKLLSLLAFLFIFNYLSY
jgi:hypothetical protein